MKTAAVIGIAICIVAFFFGAFSSRNKKLDHEINGADYASTIEVVHVDKTYAYDVAISEVDSPYLPGRCVILTPVEKESPLPTIKGNDYDRDGKWNSVAYSDYTVRIGTNSFKAGNNWVVLQASGAWKFDPCSCDRNRVQPFTNEQILFALKMLDIAVAKVRNPEHLVSTYFWNEEQKRLELVEMARARPVQNQ